MKRDLTTSLTRGKRGRMFVVTLLALCLCVSTFIATTPAIADQKAEVSATTDVSEKPVKDPFAASDLVDDPYGVNKTPDDLVGIGVDDSKLGNTIDFNTAFRDHKNNLVRIGDLFAAGKPVLLSFNYSDCPKLCSVQLENMVETLSQIDFKIGTDIKMVSVSIDPKETSQRAQQSIDIYTNQYNLAEARDGFHFLVGDEPSIKTLTDETGFRFRYIEDQKRYSHPPLFVILSPKGKIVRYIHGLDYDPKTMTQAFIEAAEGRIGSPINLASYGLGCFVFDESTGKYTFQAMAIMRIGGLLTIVGLIGSLAPYWFFRRNRKAPEDSNSHNSHSSGSSMTPDAVA